ncbi:alpha-amylase domain-containing protein, partial [Burkholderia sp. SIMBA_045]
PNCIAFMRTGDKKNKGCLVIISNNGKACKEIMWGEEYSNAVFYDFLQQRQEEIVVDNNGKGIFKVNARSVSVWVKK